MALLHLLHRWALGANVCVQAVTVDHGLRREAKDEAAGVGAFCKTLGIGHKILHWTDWDGAGNLQDQARRARLGLLSEWAKAQGIPLIALGHTLDDQAETFLMRLKRGSGVDGLSGMAMQRQSDGITWVRPLLMHTRQALRDYLSAQNIGWIEDPSNEDERFDRVKVRKAIAVLSDLGISPDRLAGTAQDLQPARAALELQTRVAAQSMVSIEAGDVVINTGKFGQLPAEIRGRLLAHALQWIASAEYRPRRRALNGVAENIDAGKASTLHGCCISLKKAHIRITREHQAVKDTVCATNAIWDKRWHMNGPHTKGLEIRALGEAGLASCPDWRNAGIPRASLMSTPAIWQNQALIAAPMARFAKDWLTTPLFGLDHFISSIISH